MLSIQFLILPRLRAKNSGSAGHTELLEELLSVEGYTSCRADRTQELSEQIDCLNDSDVVMVEVRDAADLGYCEDLRRMSKKPLLMYGWNIPSSTWIKGLQGGADAFLSLVEREEVTRARLQAALRRTGIKTA